MKYKRFYSRKKSSIPAIIEANGFQLTTSIRDVSMQGAYVVSKKPLAIGEKIIIRSEYMMIGVPFEIEAEVVSQRDDGVGVRFDCVTETQKQWVSCMFR